MRRHGKDLRCSESRQTCIDRRHASQNMDRQRFQETEGETDRTASNGVNGRRWAVGVEWLRVVAGDVRHTRALTWKSLCVPVETNQRTGVVCLTDSRLPVVFVASVIIVAVMTVFPMAVLWCSVVTPSGALIPRPKEKTDRTDGLSGGRWSN